MKIAIWHNFNSGGGKRALYYHVKGLVERGHDLEAWCPETADKTYLPLTEFIPENRVPAHFGHFRLWHQRLMDFTGSKRFFTAKKKWDDFDRHCRICAEQINQKGFDVLFANSSVFLAVAPIARYVTCPKIIYLQEPYRINYECSSDQSHNKSNFMGVLKDISHLIRKEIIVRKERENARSFDRILVNSFYSRESVARAYGLESSVCYLGIDAEFFKPEEELKENYIAGMGFIGNHKGIDRVIKALGSLDESIRLPLIWVGNHTSQGYMNQMRLLAEKLNVQVEFKAGISDKDLVSLLSRAKLMVYASRLEPFGFAPLEANACGTPVVAIAEGGVRETIKEGINGFLVEDADTIIFARKIEQALKAPNLNQMSFSARDYVLKHWGWEPAIDRLESFLKSMSSKSGAQKP